MIRSSFFCLLILFSSQLVYSQQKENHLTVPGSDKVHFGNKSTGIPSYVKLSDKVKLEGLNTWMGKVFKLNKDHKVEQVKSTKDELGFTHHKFQQYYKGYPVEGAVYIVHEKDNYIHSLNGMMQDNLSVDGKVTIGEAAALSKALGYIKADKYIWEDKNEEALLKSNSNDPSATNYPKGTLVIANNRLGKGSYRLAYKFDIYATSPLRRAYVYVDANNGSVININDRIHHHNHNHSKKETCHTDGINEIEHTSANAIGTAVTKYSGTQTITTENTGSVYRLRETGRGNGIQTFNMNRGISYTSATDFTDADNTWNTTTNYDNAAYDAHWGAEKTYDYYMTTHNLNSFDGLGAIIKNYVHYDTDFDNAYWDGSRMTYGDGSNTFGGFTALTAIDVIGHELSHAVTEYSSNLDYSDESGALNESFSDIMGTTVEFYAKPASANFLIGDQISYGGGALRSMSNPNLYDQPDTYLGDMWDFGQEVHTNSGVGNYWYYLLCQGGSGTNDVGNAFSVTGVGITKAAKITYRAFTFYLTSTSTYADARFYSIQAALDLYGPCTPEVQAVTNAWYAVGVGAAYVAGVSSDFSASGTSFCATPAAVTFNNLSQNANTFSWNFGDGGSSTAASPSHTYTNYGTYTVTLTATGGACGTDTETKTGYIVVSNLVTCPVNIPVSGTGQLQTKCTGKLYDSGGQSNYADLTDGTITIAPAGASKVTLSFSSFNLEDGYDYLYIYDGPNTSSPLIGTYTGTSLPNGGTINSSGGSITINQFSDTYVNASGFVCDWSCTVPNAAPVAAFSATSTASCDGIVTFTDQSSNGPSSWNWTFGDGTTSTLQNPVKTYTASGTYTVTLKSCNTGFGCSSILTKTNYVTVSLGSCINLPQTGTGATQTACSGKLFDSGGSSGNYQSGTNGTMTIAPTGATKVTLTFTSFSFESGYDYLYIYDGPSISSNIIGQYSGTNLPGGGTINSTGGSITLRQVSDGTIEQSGFVCNWACTKPTSAPVAAFAATPTSTCDGIVNFTDLSTNGPTSWNWTFGDGTTSTSQNPVKTYTANGTYTVTLNACNGIGCNLLTKTSYVTVALGGCVNLPQSGTGTTQTTCSGRLYDSGGNNDYQSNTSGTITISPVGASKVNLNFSSFNFESGYDFLYIYDGPNTSSTLIGSYTGATLPNGGIVSSTGGSITIKQTSDNSISKSGFVCDWSCVATNSKPSAAFTANTTSSCNGVISFTDQSTNTPTSWTWDFGDGTTSTSKNPTKTYTTNGTFNVTLNACNSFGCNSVIKYNFVTVNLTSCVYIPASGTIANQTSCSGRLYDSGGLSNYTNNTNGTLTIAPTGATSVVLSFTSFDFESGYDFLKIFDGPSTSSPLIGTYSGTSLPGFGTITSTGGAITLQQTSDASNVNAGFVCDWSCISSKPTPNFSVSATTTCNGLITFTDLSSPSPASWIWNFGDGTNSTSQNPSHTYLTSGVYSVTLNACNANGCSTLVMNNLITVNLSNCLNMPSTGTGTTQTTCTGTIKDNGGLNNYDTDTDGIITISPAGASSITLNFSSFNMEDSFDYLIVYDGPDINSPIIGYITGDSINSFSLSSTGGSITLEQTSDYSIQESGFICDWTCHVSTSKPTPAFTVSSTNTCSGLINFTDQSSQSPTSWTWNFGDGSTSNSRNPSHTYLTSGTFTVSLNTCNAIGCSTVVMTNLITVNLSSCLTMPSIGTGTTQTACTGTIKDSGGSGDYDTDTDGIITISPTGASKVTLTFSSFNMEDSFDYLIVYDGPDINSPIIGYITGDSINSFSLNSTGGSVTLEQTSDYSYNESGFICAWSCQNISAVNKGISGQTAINLFPNPAYNEVDLSFTYSGIKKLNIVINDLLGNVLYKEEGTFDGKYQNRLDVSSFQSGVYFIIINDGDETVSRKLTIAK